MMRLTAVVCLTIVYFFVDTVHLHAQGVNDRYMYRVPDWLWTQQPYSSLISADARGAIEYDISVAKALGGLEDSRASDEVEAKIAAKLCELLAVRDLTANAPTVENCNDGTKLALQIDPDFEPRSRDTILKAAELFLKVALDETVIKKAIDSSITTPSPMPEMYEMENGAPKLDRFGNKVFTGAYAFYIQQRHRPDDVAAFRTHFKGALSSHEGDPALLVVSKYSGNVWWGGGYYDFFHDGKHQLSRLRPSRGFLYIRLNSDKLTEGQENWDNPVFWASKIAHEVLHNIGYWHPNYTDPAQRDLNNQGATKAFIVAYEQEVFSRLNSPK